MFAAAGRIGEHEINSLLTNSQDTMKAIRSLFKVLALAAGLLASQSIRASQIDFYVLVPGYSSAGWIQVRPELRSLLGGRVAYLPQYGGWVTDRIARGETFYSVFSPNRTGERTCLRGAISGVDVTGGTVTFANRTMVYLRGDIAARSASVDAASAWTITEAGYFERRVPIGSRP